MAYPEVGTHAARAVEGSVYETEGGALMAGFRCVPPPDSNETWSIMASVCMVTKDGTPMEKNIERLKDVFAWDGADPMWLQDSDFSALPIDIVVDDEPSYKDKTKIYKVVKWINKPGAANGNGQELKKSDKSAIAAKFGAKFRALASMSHTTPKAAAKPPPPPKKTPPPPPPREGPTATMDQAWDAYCAAGHDANEWHAFIEAKTKKTADALDGYDWQTVKEQSEIPF